MHNDLLSLAGVWENSQYSKSKEAVERMRVSVEGEDAIKDEGETYLPHPCTNDTKKHEPAEQNRYRRFICSAEYDGVPSNTLETLTGAMFRIDPVIELPTKLEYLREDADGNGNGISQSLELTASECLQMRFHCALVEYSSLAGLDIADTKEITNADATALNLRATIKHYARENLINWSFAVINGVKQLNMVLLYQVEHQVLDPNDLRSDGLLGGVSASLLMLAIDENGEYFQKKLVLSDGKNITNSNNEAQWGEAFYPLANGERLKFIPFEIIYSTERNVGNVPRQLGYLDPISLKCIHRYQVSALLKESLRITAQPTSFTKGWRQQDFELYKQMTGETQINLGSTNHLALPENCDAGYLTWDADTNGLFKYMETNQAEIVALGGNFEETGENAETATAAAINSAEKKAVLSTLVKNEEESYRRLIDWVGLFMNVDTSEVVIKMSREFVSIKLSPLERAAILNEWREDFISYDEALRQMKRGGALVSDIEDLKAERMRDGIE